VNSVKHWAIYDILWWDDDLNFGLRDEREWGVEQWCKGEQIMQLKSENRHWAHNFLSWK